MKILKLILAVSALALAVTGCSDDNYYYYENNLSTTIYTIKPEHWELNLDGEPGSNNYFYCTVDNKDITAEVMDKGAVQAFVYYTYNKQENLSAWTTLPFVYPMEFVETDTDTGTQTVTVVPENLRFEWEEGSVTFIIQDLDGYSPSDIKNTMSIKVCVGL